MGATEFSAQISFDRNNYMVGDTVRVLIVCDNIKCKSNVKSFKLKLKRKFWVTCWSDFENKKDMKSELKETKHASAYVVEVRVDGCKSGEKVERTIDFIIPEIDNQPKGTLDPKTKKELMDPFARKTFQQFTPSV